ncbi:hypothetical protein ATCC90586_000498 [Pythium insidiosum]|nr:hypothetical protein ATCC90586_000498 [Pythium insidiosum]
MTISDAPTTRARRPLRKPRKKPPALAPIAAAPTPTQRNQRHQRDASDAKAAALPLAPVDIQSRALPLDVVFLNRYRHILRQHVSLRGWTVSDSDLRLFPAARGGRTETLDLEDCSRITADGLHAALPALPQLRVLNLRRCSALAPPVVRLLSPTLVDVTLDYCDWLDDNSVRLLARQCPSLHTASLQHCRQLTDYGVAAFADVLPKPVIASLAVSHCPRVTDTALLALLVKCPRLRELRAASLSRFEGFTLEGLPRSTGYALETLYLARNARMHPQLVPCLMTRLGNPATRLREIDVSFCPQVDDDALVAIGRHAPALRVFRAAFCVQLTDFGLVRLVQFVPPETDGDAGSQEDATLPRCSAIETLDLTGCYQITSDGVIAVARHCGSTLASVLVDGVRRLDASALRQLASHCTQLHTLHWGGILIQSAAGDAPAAPSNSTGFFSVPTVDRPAATAFRAMPPTLHTLRLGTTTCDVEALATATLSAIGPQLRDLDVTAIATDALVTAIASHCRGLRSLRLARSRYFHEASFLLVASQCVELRALDLESCEQLGDSAVCTLARHARKIERLVLTNDWQVTDTSVSLLGKRCTSLLRLQVRHCPEVSLACLREIARFNPLVLASRDGLTPRPASVLAFLRLDREMDAAARRLTRWLRDCITDRHDTKSQIDRMIRHLRRRKRAVIRIQRCVRRFQRQQRQREAVARALAEQRARVEACWRWVAAYCRGCRGLRAWLRGWRVARKQAAFRLAEQLRLRREEAAITIQRVERGWRGRQRAAARRQELRRILAQREASATTVQRCWRGHRTRQDVVAPHRRAWLRRILHDIERKQRQLWATTQIARVIRGALARRVAAERREARVKWIRLRELSATRIQRNFRAFRVRRLLAHCRHVGATALQRVFRGYYGRRLARSIVLARAFVHAPRLLLLSPRSIFTLDLAAQWKRRRDAAELVATALQPRARGYYNGRLQRDIALAARRQEAFRRDASARALQHFFRSNLIVKRLHALQATMRRRKRAATRIQSVWRMWTGKVVATALALRRHRAQRHAATRAALSASDPSVQHRRVLLQLGAMHVLVGAYRSSLLQRGWLAPSVRRFRDKCATRIQALVRGHLTRRWVHWFREQLTAATRRVQRAWRSHQSREAWRALVLERRLERRRQDEEDRAARVAGKLTAQFALDAGAREHKGAAVLQQWYRTLRRRQVFQAAAHARNVASAQRGREKLAEVQRLSTDSVVFQARVWRDCVVRKQELLAMEDEEIEQLEKDVAALRQGCLDAYAAHAEATETLKELQQRKRDALRTKKRLSDGTARVKVTIQPFAEQAKRLTVDSARVHVTNKQLQTELNRLKQSVKQFNEELRATLPLEPLLYERDLERLLAVLGPAAPMTKSRLGDASPQIIAAPDKGDELEERAFTEGQERLDDSLRSRHLSGLIDINVYTVTLPTQYVIGLLLDPCRKRAYDCCSERFGEPAYTTVALAAKEKISLLDESGAPFETAYITQCSGAFALDNHCGTFLELHEPGNEIILSQTRLLGEYPSGFRTTTLPLFFQGNKSRTICRGDYEIWWVQRTKYNFIVQKKKKFRVVSPECDFDFATNKYKNYHELKSS